MDIQTNKFGVQSIRNRILFFALLITLLPSFGMGWLLNNMMHSTVTEKSEQKLRHSANIIEREIALWFKERNYDLYVFSNSFVISDNYSRYLHASTGDKVEEAEAGAPAYIRVIETYLASVQNQFEDYTRLFVLNPEGSIVATSHPVDEDTQLHLPENMDEQIEASKYLKGDVYFDAEDGIPRMLIGTPLYTAEHEKHIGILAIEVRLQGVLELMQTALVGINWDTKVYGTLLRLADGRHFLSTDTDDNLRQPVRSSQAVLHLFDGLLGLQAFVNHQDVRVVGILSPLAQLEWGLIVAESYDEVFAQVNYSRNRNIVTVGLLGMIIGILAYMLARQIIQPLDALTRGAQQVADGNLSVQLAIRKHDELGIATRVFNEMVAELNQSQAKLELLATTDALTALANRKHIMELLEKQFEYYKRYATEFSVLMVDVDHFKKVNDTFGHQAGDSVLREIGKIFSATLRNVDAAGRYGGEEFLVILAESDEEDAQSVAERIRLAVKDHTFTHESEDIRVTVSLGVATITKTDENESSLIKRADQALYQAKDFGRNQSVYISASSTGKTATPKIISIVRSAEK